jgi:hypothetical protein
MAYALLSIAFADVALMWLLSESDGFLLHSLLLAVSDVIADLLLAVGEVEIDLANGR